MIKLFLDDIRNPDWLYEDYKDWVVVRNDTEFKKFILENIDNIFIISFDNDLGVDKEGVILPDGYHCLNWLIDNDIYIKNIIVHSDNIIANEQIYGKAKNWYKFIVNEFDLDINLFSVIKREAKDNLRKEYVNNINNK